MLLMAPPGLVKVKLARHLGEPLPFKLRPELIELVFRLV